MTASMIKRILGIEFYRLSPEERKELIIAQTEDNLDKEKKLAIIIMFISFILLYVDLTRLQDMWLSNVAYKRLFFLHIINLVALVIFLMLLEFRNRSIIKRSLRFDSFLCNGLIIFSLIWCAFLSINAQFLHGQISAYIIGAFCISSTITLSPRNNFIIYGISYIIFLIGLFLYQDDFSQIVGGVINSSFLIILAIVSANLHFSNYVSNFINKKIISEKTQELEDSRRNLEKVLKNRTDKLNRYNKILIDEINKRHDLEMEALANKLKYEQEKSFLNQKIEYEKLRTEFFANLSHELRTPLNVIFSAQQILVLMIKDSIDDEKATKVNKYLKVIKQNCYRLIRLIGNLIDITKIDVGNLKIEFQNLDIVELTENIVYSVREYIEEKEILLIFDSSIRERVIACDPDKIERIILNLLSNAVKFTPEYGRISVNISEVKENVIISVKDSGIGIAPDKLKVIFERFVQVDKSTVRKREGSGIGLSLVKSLVEMHRGDIRCESKEGEGTEFIIELPVVVLENTSKALDEIAVGSQDKVERINVEFSDIYYD